MNESSTENISEIQKEKTARNNIRKWGLFSALGLILGNQAQNQIHHHLSESTSNKKEPSHAPNP